jgi:8-oxo-dGTP diphosphatase
VGGRAEAALRWGGALSSAGMDVTLIVDGANVMGSRADGWWRDRAGAMARLHSELAALAARGIRGPVPGDLPESRGSGDAGDGPGSAGAPEPGSASAPEPGSAGAPGAGQDDPDGHWYPQVILVVEGRTRKVLSLVSPAPGVQVVAARGEGDDEIADLAGRLPGPRVVVTADRELRRRVTAAGAAVTGPGWLLRQFR